MAGKFVLSRTPKGEYRFTLKAGNGEPILASEGYKAKRSAEDGIASVRRNAAVDERYERKETKGGEHMFNLKATNGQVIGTSEGYKTEASREGGIASVKRNAPDAKVDDQTEAA